MDIIFIREFKIETLIGTPGAPASAAQPLMPEQPIWSTHPRNRVAGAEQVMGPRAPGRSEVYPATWTVMVCG